MYLRYPNQCEPNNCGAGASSYSNFGDMPDVFLEWNKADPVDQYEINRNDIIHVNQGNRNPFIDNTYLATVIWNGPVADNPWGPLEDHINSSSFDFNFYPNPVKNKLFCESSYHSGNFDVDVYDVFCKHLATFKSTAIDMKEFKAGVYVLMVNQGENKKTFKIIKE